MPTIIILRGNSGSGKSSVARELQRRIGNNTLLISQDMVRREMLRAHDGKDTSALPLLIHLLNYGFLHGEYTILEGILNADWYRPLFESAVELFGNRVFAYYYDIPFEETLKRHQTKQNKSEFGEAEMRRWWNEKDLIKIIPEHIFTREISLEDAVATIMNDMLLPI
jgi:predicted kinase